MKRCTTTYSYDEYGHQSSSTSQPRTEVEGATSTATKIATVAAGATAGGLVGSTIKKGWQKIYPSEEANDKASAGLSLSDNSSGTLVLAIQYRF